MMTNRVVIIAVLIVLAMVFLGRREVEGFWGGYFPVPYLGQPVPRFGRTAVIASTDSQPSILIDEGANFINPSYCGKCRCYRCRCHK
jgi:hypothetical protein